MALQNLFKNDELMRVPITGWLQTVTATCISFLLLACSPDKVPSGLVYCSEGNPESFNPQLVTSGTTIDATSHQIYNRLLDYAPDNHTLVPALATDWQVSDDGLSYRFTLRDNVHFHQSSRFHPSRTFNADDVLFSFNRIIQTSHPFHDVSRSGYPFFDSIKFADQIAKIEKVSDREVIFHLKQPDAAFLSNLASAFAVILSAEYGEQLYLAGRPELLDQQPIGTGPFALSQYVKNDYIRYRRHPNYWGTLPEIEMLVYDITPKSGSRLVKLITGDCSVSALPKAGELSVVKIHDDLKLTSTQGMNVAFWALNTQKPPLDRVEVRRALAMAIDRESILNAVYRDTGVLANGILPPISWAYSTNQQERHFDPVRARQILKQAGVQGLTLDIWAIPVGRSYNPNSLKTAELIQSDLANIGVKVNIISYGWSVFAQKLNSSDYDSVLIGWNADNNDPDNFFTPLLSCGSVASGTNRSRWCNAQFEQLIHQARLINNTSSRAQLYREAEQIMLEQVPLVPLAHAQRQLLTRDNITHMQMTPFGGISFADIQFSSPGGTD